MLDRTYQTESDTLERVTFYCWWSDGNLLLLFSSMSKDKMDAEKLIALVHSRPELWNQNHQLYSSRDMKFKVWQQLGRQLGVTGSAAKLKWTCLRDTFRREVKKTYQHVTDENGKPQEPYVPKWTHFRSMLFLKDMMLRDGHSHRPQQQQQQQQSTATNDNSNQSQSSHFLEPLLNEQTTTIKSSVDNDMDDDDISDDDLDPLGAYEDDTAPFASRQRRLTSSYVSDVHSIKRTVSDNYGTDDGTLETEPKRPKRTNVEVDEDYHFLQSILPSLRKIHSSRKTLFKMKLLQLIYEEEQYSETSSSRNSATEASTPSTTNIQVKEEILE